MKTFIFQLNEPAYVRYNVRFVLKEIFHYILSCFKYGNLWFAVHEVMWIYRIFRWSKLSLMFQITLMTELREIVAVEDRFKFDELVYGRDSSSRTNPRDPREHDYRHSRVSFTIKFTPFAGRYFFHLLENRIHVQLEIYWKKWLNTCSVKSPNDE